MDREDMGVAGLQMLWEQAGMGEYVKCWTPWGWFPLGLFPVLSIEPCPALPRCWGWLAPFLWPCMWGKAMLRRGIAPRPPCPWRESPPSLTLLGIFFLPQTGAAKCGTW